ncbi:DUF1488 domain-containing protein [Paraburkholderia sp. A2WS-5]
MGRDPAVRRCGFSSADFPTGLDMDIRFPSEAPSWHDANLTVGFPALVDGARVPCAISVEALEDHFGALSAGRDAWMQAFDAGRARIEAVARAHLELSNGTPVLLKSGHFPPGTLLS